MAEPVRITEIPRLPPRPVDANKGHFGRVMIVAGSRGMSGAAVLCGSAALRGGAGLVRVAVPQCVWPIVAAGNPCYMTTPLPEDEHGGLAASASNILLPAAAASTVVAAGPGLAQGPGVAAIILELVEQTQAPLVLDADALNAVGQQSRRLANRAAPLILTPHPGEFARLLRCDVATVQRDRETLAVRFASDHKLVLVLKGQETVVTDGQRCFVNSTGNPGMATGGTGDVLTGLIAALLGQGLDAFTAAQLGVYLHGVAGDLARDTLGEVSLIASDLLHYLPAAIQQM